MFRPTVASYEDDSYFGVPEYMQEMATKRGRKRPFIIPTSDDLTLMNRRNLFRNKIISNQVGLTETDGISKNNLWKSLIHKHKSQIIQGKKHNSKSNRLLSYFRKFCNTTSLHGFHFLVERERNFCERAFWMLSICIVYVCCILLIKSSITEWLDSPAIMSIENNPTPVGLIPFPAITVCGANQIKPSVFNISTYFALSDEEKTHLNHTYLQYFDYATMFCRMEPYNEEQDVLELRTFHYMLNYAHISCEETFAMVKWTNETLENPCDYMQPVLTDMGLCYSFNMLPLKVLLSDYYFEVVQLENSRKNLSLWSKMNKTDWTPQRGYKVDRIRADDIPKRTSGAGSLHALTMLLDTYNEDYGRHCNSGSRGFTILVHSPAHMPSSAHAKVGVSQSSLHWVTILPKKLNTSRELEMWSPENRGCYFDRERKLHFFNLYTQTNCDLECESNYSLRSCGCVAFYHPRTLFTPICGSKKMDCIEDSLVKFSELYSKDKRGCDCLPSCATLEYDSDVMSIDVISKLQPKRILTPNQTETKKNIISEFSTVTVTYQSRDTLGFLRRGMYGFTDFLGNIGGIMGLFLGFSWISLLEIIYFVVLRPIANNQRERNHSANS